MLRVPVIATNIAEWVRLAANAINQLAPINDSLLAGPFADDAAAKAGGVAVGSVYRKPDGTLGWRVS